MFKRRARDLYFKVQEVRGQLKIVILDNEISKNIYKRQYTDARETFTLKNWLQSSV